MIVYSLKTFYLFEDLFSLKLGDEILIFSLHFHFMTVSYIYIYYIINVRSYLNDEFINFNLALPSES